jgi:hypothetical protein
MASRVATTTTRQVARPILLVLVLVLVSPALGRTCRHADTHNGTAFDLSGCTSLDLSCPAEGTRVPGCDNILAPKEIAELARAMGEGDVATTLTAIDLGGSPLGKVGTATLAPRLAACTKLSHLGLASTRIGDAGLRLITSALLLAKGGSVASLDVSHNSIGDDGVRALVTGLKSASASAGAEAPAVGLAKLDLSWNSFGPRGGRYLAEGLKDTAVSSLSELRVSWNGLADRGARALGEALASNAALTLLDLEYNAIKDEGAKAFAKGLRSNGALKTLLLGHNGVSAALHEEVQQALLAEPTQPAARKADATAAGGGGGGRGAGGGHGAASADEDEEEVEEISMDDDIEMEAEAQAEKAEEERERARRVAEAEAAAAAREAEAATEHEGPCVDKGPWACQEDGCPSDPLGCDGLAELGLCQNAFGEVWEASPPDGLGSELIAMHCPVACKRCVPAKDEL